MSHNRGVWPEGTSDSPTHILSAMVTVHSLYSHPFDTSCEITSLREKATIHQVTTIVATSKNVLFSGPNHLLTASTYDPTLSKGNN